MQTANQQLPANPRSVSSPAFPIPHPHEDRVIIRPYPKIIMYFPTMLTAVFCGIAAYSFSGNVSVLELLGTVFMCVFFLNTIIVAFEFPRMTAVAVVLLLVAIIFGLLLLNRYLGVIHFLAALLLAVHAQANAQFYFIFAGVFVFVFCIAWIITRFDYWEVLNNELLHHHGPFGDLERFPAPQLKLDKEIPDIFEYLLFRSGRLIFYPTSERRALFVENVMGVNQIEARIKHLLEALEVRLEDD